MCSAQRDRDWRQRAGLMLCPMIRCVVVVLTCRHERHEETNEEVSSQLIGRRLVGGAELDKGKSSKVQRQQSGEILSHGRCQSHRFTHTLIASRPAFSFTHCDGVESIIHGV